jgi:hypothetical protein
MSTVRGTEDRTEEEEEKFRFKLVGGFFLLRLVNPCIQDPSLLPDLYSGEVTPAARKNLTTIANAIQHLSNVSEFKKEKDLHLNAWLKRAGDQLTTLFARVACNPLLARGFNRPETRQVKLHRGKSASQNLTAEDAAFAMECFRNTKDEVQKRAAVDPAVVISQLFYERLEETSTVPGQLENQWVLLLEASKVSKKNTIKKLFRAPPFKKRFAVHSSTEHLIRFFKSDESDQLESFREINLRLVRGCYAREDAGLLELETTTESFVFNFQEDVERMFLWETIVQQWMEFLHQPKRSDKLHGHLLKDGRKRWFHQVNDKLYYFEDFLAGTLGYIDLGRLLSHSFPTDKIDGQWQFELVQAVDKKGKGGMLKLDSMIEDEEVAAVTLVAESVNSYFYWRDGIQKLCSKSKKKSMMRKTQAEIEKEEEDDIDDDGESAGDFADGKAKGGRGWDSDKAGREFREDLRIYGDCPPHFGCLLDWIDGWRVRSPKNGENCAFVLFGEQDTLSGCRQVLNQLKKDRSVVTSYYPEHIGGALKLLLSYLIMPLIPSLQYQNMTLLLVKNAFIVFFF